MRCFVVSSYHTSTGVNNNQTRQPFWQLAAVAASQTQKKSCSSTRHVLSKGYECIQRTYVGRITLQYPGGHIVRSSGAMRHVNQRQPRATSPRANNKPNRMPLDLSRTVYKVRLYPTRIWRAMRDFIAKQAYHHHAQIINQTR